MITRRTLLKSAAAALGLALVPKGVKALVAPSDDVTVAQYAAWVNRIMSAPSKATMMIVGGRLITLVDGRWRMGLIDQDNVPPGTTLEEWGTHVGSGQMRYGHLPADDVEGYVTTSWCSYSHGGDDTLTQCVPAACRFGYTGKHPIYRQLFPVPLTPIQRLEATFANYKGRVLVESYT